MEAYNKCPSITLSDRRSFSFTRARVWDLYRLKFDHADDQKKSHEILRIWRLEEEAIHRWWAERVLGIKSKADRRIGLARSIGLPF